ncbi:MAG: hypothetical protein ACI4OJ_12240 [Lachnospiraceae bacterium]
METARKHEDQDLTDRICAFQKDTETLRASYERALSTGIFPASLVDEQARLSKEGEALLTFSLPAIRKRFLDRKDIDAKAEVLLTPGEDDSASTGISKERLLEADLSEKERALVQTLLDGEAPEEELPEELEALCADRDLPVYLAPGTDCVRFLFTEEGDVYLAEENSGWMIRQAPLFTGLLAQAALAEGDARILVLDGDGRVVRLSYDRIDIPEKAMRLNLYG